MPLHERARLAGVAVDAVFDSVSVATTFKERLAAAGVVFCPFSEAVRNHPQLIEQYLGSVVPYTDNFFATLNSAVFSDGSFVYVPKGVRCPMELSTYFRINALNTGQFERTLIIADVGSYVSYLEGCSAPQRDENQLHAAVVELVALDDARIKYSTVQNWYPGDANGVGGIYNFVTKRGECRGRNAHISWTQVETGSAITWKYPSCVLRGEGSIGEFYSVATVNHHQQADTGTKMIHIGRNTRSTIISKGISAGHGQNTYRGLVKMLPSAHGARNFTQCDSLLMGGRCGAHTFPYVEVKNPSATVEHEASTSKISEDQLFYLLAARHRRGGRGQHDRQRLLQVGLQGAADGVRGGGAEPAGGEPRRRGGLEAMSKPDSALLSIDILPSASRASRSSTASASRWRAGEVHAIMGPNGSGKSTLAHVLAGRPGYQITAGTVQYLGRDLFAMAPEERARAGLFLGFQYPVEIPGVNNVYLLKAAVNAVRKQQGLPEVDAFDFLGLVRGKMQLMQIDDSFLSRGVNEGFSGGEKKRNEILQMLVLEPRLAILDETDSGLDIDALKVVAAGVNSQRGPERSCVLVTHYQRLLEYVVPDCVHVLVRGRIARSGDRSLALELERRGYDWVDGRSGLTRMSSALTTRIAADYASIAAALPATDAAGQRRRAAIEALEAVGLPGVAR